MVPTVFMLDSVARADLLLSQRLAEHPDSSSPFTDARRKRNRFLKLKLRAARFRSGNHSPGFRVPAGANGSVVGVSIHIYHLCSNWSRTVIIFESARAVSLGDGIVPAHTMTMTRPVAGSTNYEQRSRAIRDTHRMDDEPASIASPIQS